MDLQTCVGCSTDLPVTVKFCPNCGGRSFAAKAGSDGQQAPVANQLAPQQPIHPAGQMHSPVKSALESIIGSAGGLLIIAIVVFTYFPGGTILMALSCNSSSLDGWDWVLSVVIPGYGLIKGIFLC